ncbi:MAG: pirin family protein [Gammaproteobacteria bacterium]|nr:pirin family protein [Gammaproteobacteria bacterium]NNJ92807.1 pirin family protein [Gammaproteobacteria bacterium]
MTTISQIIRGMPATDGAGVELSRVIGQPALPMLDPFLLLDVFRSDKPDDYIAGFPPHPHRGFETVTYLLEGRMRHKDNAGHEGVIESGGIQWMTAGKGIVHSEMPEQQHGLLEGFQLWVNLPAKHKMTEPTYQEFSSEQLPVERREGNVEVSVITGTTSTGTQGPVNQPLTDPLYLDVKLPRGRTFVEPLNPEYNAFIYIIKGPLTVGDNGTRLDRDQLAVLNPGEELIVSSMDQDVRFIMIAGKPLNEPVERGGPFVMNSREEIDQAFADYRGGKF